MAVINPTVDLNPYATQLAEIERRKRMAELLQQQGMEPLESQTVGGRVIPISPWQVLAKALQTGMGAYQGGKANQAAADLQDRMAYDQRQKEAEDLATQQGMIGRMYGEKNTYTPPEPTETPVPDEMGNTPRPYKPITLQQGQAASGDRNQALAEALKAGRSVGSNDQLEEITPTGKYTYDPKAAIQMAMTPQGLRAMQQNPLIAAGITAAMKPKELEIGSIDPSKFTPESIREASQTGDIGKLKFITAPANRNLQLKTRTTYDKNGNEIHQDYNYDPSTGTSTPVGQQYSGKPAEKKEAPSDQMTPDALALAVEDVAAHPENIRNYASFGAAGQSNRIAINNGIAAKLKESGMTNNDLLKLRVSAKANAASAQKLQAQANAVDAFEKVGRANGERVLELIERLDKTGVPLAEGLLRSVSNKFGSADAAELQSVLTSFQTEVGRILSNPNMTGVISDSARHEIQDMAPGTMSATQARRVIKRLFTEMDLRKQYTQDAVTNAVNATTAFPPSNAGTGMGAPTSANDPLGLRR
jgi:hypothetical protein